MERPGGRAGRWQTEDRGEGRVEGAQSMQENRKQLLINTISNGGLFLLNALIGLWMTPYLINQLGIEVYGMIPLANQITSYLSLLTLVITGGVGRFLSIEIIKRNSVEANKVFNTTFFASLWLVILALPFTLIFIYFLPNLINVPLGTEIETQFLFLVIFITFFLTFLQTPFLVSSWVKNRFDLRNIAIAASKIIQVVSLILLFNFLRPEPWEFGLSLLISNIFAFGAHYFIWNKLTPELKISYKYYEKGQLRDIVDLGKWIVIDQIGTLLLLNIDLLMANQLLGTKAGGEYGSLSILPSTFRIFVISIMSVISPIQMKNYALDEFDSLRKISTYSVRMLSIFSALGVGTICGFSKSILRVWLGNEFVHLWLPLIILMVPLFLTLPFQPLYQLQVAYKKVKFPAIATFAAGILNILLIFNFTKTLHMGVEGIGIACGLAFSLRTVLFSSIYGAFIQNLHWTNYIKEILPGTPLIIVSYGISHILTAFYQISNLLTLLLSMGFVLSITFLLGYLLIYKKEIKMLKDFVISKGLSVEI